MHKTAPPERELYRLAAEAAQRAHAPYSSFPVGCVIVDEANSVHTGCNVENASFGLTLCAERVAAGSAIAAGAKKFKTVIVASKDAVSPCGACRQVLAEFSDSETTIVQIDLQQNQQAIFRLSELLPNQFTFQSKTT